LRGGRFGQGRGEKFGEGEGDRQREKGNREWEIETKDRRVGREREKKDGNEIEKKKR